MNQKDKNTITRRDFVKGGTVAIAATACMSVGLREALARARAGGGIILTAANLNRLFAEKRAAGKIKQLALEINRDIKGWIRREVVLTPIQEKRISACTKADWDNISKVLKFVEATGAQLSIEISDPSGQTSHHATSASCRTKVKAEVKNSDGSTKQMDADISLEI